MQSITNGESDKIKYFVSYEGLKMQKFPIRLKGQVPEPYRSSSDNNAFSKGISLPRASLSPSVRWG